MEVPLTQGKFAIIDDEDYELIKDYKWYCDNNRAVTNGKFVKGKRLKKLLMHRLILGIEDGTIIDHIDQNPLNNLKSNLRVTNKVLNGLNRGPSKRSTSGFKGVHWHKHTKKWFARIQFNGRGKHLGYFDTKEEAAIAYQKILTRFMEDGYQVLTTHIEPYKKES